MSFAVIIPSRNSANVEACVSGLRAMGEACKVVVVDDGLDVRRTDCEYIDGVKPFNFPEAINRGTRAAGKHDGYIWCNDDAILKTPFGFSELHRVAQENPDFGCIGAVTNITGAAAQRPHGIGLRKVEPNIAYICVYVPHSTLENVQWMDPRYCIDYGCCDNDHCEAIHRAGLKVGVYDFTFVDHSSLKSTYRGEPTNGLPFQKNYALFRQKWAIV